MQAARHPDLIELVADGGDQLHEEVVLAGRRDEGELEHPASLAKGGPERQLGLPPWPPSSRTTRPSASSPVRWRAS